MTKAQEIIKTIDELTRHYGKIIGTYWLPWIPTIALLIFNIYFIKYIAETWGQTSDPIPSGWIHVFIALALFIFPWVAGLWVGEIPYKKKDKDKK